jgi:spermidine synthase
LVVLDAYSKTFVPFHLMTREFFEEIRADLSPNGVVISNLITYSVGSGSGLLEAEVRTLQAVFPQVYVFPTRGLEDSQAQNIMLVATMNDQRLTKDDLLSRVGTVTTPIANLQDHVDKYASVDVSRASVLTDDYAPVETLLNPITGQPLTRNDDELAALSTESIRLVLIAFIIAFGAIALAVYRRRRQKPFSQ